MEELETAPTPEVPEESAGAPEAVARAEQTTPAGHVGGDAGEPGPAAPQSAALRPAGNAPAEAAARAEQTMPVEVGGRDAGEPEPAPSERARALRPAGNAPAEAAARAEQTTPAEVGGRDAGEPGPAPPRSAAALEPAGPVPVEDASHVREPAPAEARQVSMEELLAEAEPEPPAPHVEDIQLRAVLEAIVYVAEEPLTLAQLSAALHEPAERIRTLLEQLAAEYDKPEHGITVREVAGGYKMATKPEHHEGVRSFVKSLKPPLKLSLPALETLAVIAYKQPVTAPEIMEIRGVQGAGVLKTLLDRKLIGVAGRKNVIGKPILYRTTKEFLIQFGLKDMSELPSLKEFEEIRRMALSEGDVPAPEPAAEQAAQPADAAGKPGLFHVKQFSQPAAEALETAPAPAVEPAPEPASGLAPTASAQPAVEGARQPPEPAAKPSEAAPAPAPAARQSSGPAPTARARQSAEATAQLPHPAAEAPEAAPAPTAELASELPSGPAAAASAEPPAEPAQAAAQLPHSGAEASENAPAPAAGPPADQEP